MATAAWQRSERLGELISARAADPAFFPEIPPHLYVTRRLLAARSLTDAVGRHRVSWRRMEQIFGEPEHKLRRWCEMAASSVERPSHVPGGMAGSVLDLL